MNWQNIWLKEKNLHRRYTATKEEEEEEEGKERKKKYTATEKSKVKTVML